jgi:hypothetical protein
MHPVIRSEAAHPVIRTVAAFPAPLCEACNVAMKLNGEYRASDESSASRREYQCGLCGIGRMVRRMQRRG